jgi:dihydrofolate synthase/folylpolyglutamate synthase
MLAHNPQARRALAGGLGDMGFSKGLAVFAMLGDKDIEGVIDAMREPRRSLILAPDAARAAPAAQCGASARGARARPRHALLRHRRGAFDAARREAGANDRIVVFGSFHTVAEALRSAR